jgi:hypothetical protein
MLMQRRHSAKIRYPVPPAPDARAEKGAGAYAHYDLLRATVFSWRMRRYRRQGAHARLHFSIRAAVACVLIAMALMVAVVIFMLLFEIVALALQQAPHSL